MSYLDFLAGWWSGWVVDRASNVRVELRIGPKRGHNDSASIAAESDIRLGALTVWEAGELEVEVIDISSEERVHVFSGTLSSAEDLDAHLARYIRACEGVERT